MVRRECKKRGVKEEEMGEGEKERESEEVSVNVRDSFCFKRNMMLKKADRQKTSRSVVAMVTGPSVFLPSIHQRVI